jgi:hypothetical protein
MLVSLLLLLLLLLRDCYPLLPQALQVSLMEVLAAAGAGLGSRARQRPGPGPGPQVTLKRILPGELHYE